MVVIEHVRPERPYAIRDALQRAGVPLDVRRVWRNDTVPTRTDNLSGVVVMGGPMSATSDTDFPTRRQEIDLLRDCLRHHVPTLGVCLGAQLLAVAAGADIYRSQSCEIGWGPIEVAPSAQQDPLFEGLPPELHVLHWHCEAFTLPSGATHLASSEVTPNQAFRIGNTAWGLQFHLEVVPAALTNFLATFGDEADRLGDGVATINADTAHSLTQLGPHRDQVFDRFAQLTRHAA